MEQDDPAEAVTELRERRLGALELLQAATGSGLAAYAVWARLLQPGFRRVPLRLQVPYLGASARQVENVLSLMRGRRGNMVDLGSGDGRIVLAAHRCSLRPAVGYELNPCLVGLVPLHAWRAGCSGNVCYLCKDLWKVTSGFCTLQTPHLISHHLAPQCVLGLGSSSDPHTLSPGSGPGSCWGTSSSCSSQCWRPSYRQSYPRGPEWCLGASASPPGSLWLWWVRAWTESGPTMFAVMA
ncbi:adenine nucleotide translocase lysine N-methyltransferase isoform X1 [Elephas maximus indicus]|uniref:adenine nucleotide translocase lysine N-methyltransferase isoform X1 n=1 Tax=Elephas maximus indicus TaxID=99487 RepID=UPI0021168E39|nr:adenine nucleotide translocase lysine N-methyltransferase isoform X1 [Elephas maximus indicus]